MRILRSRTLIAVASLVTAGAVLAAILMTPEAGPRQQREPESSEGTIYLEKLRAAERASYRARRLVVYLDRPQSAAVVEERASWNGTFVRSDADGDTVRLWMSPEKGVVEDDEVAMEEASPPRVPVRAKEVARKYDVRIGEPEWILGTKIVALELVRRADDKLVERLLIHPQHGVVYRRELFGGDGALIGMSMILDMEWGPAAATRESPGTRDPEQVHRKRSDGAPGELPYGYGLLQSYRLEADGRPAEHWVYSDGLHALSLFRTKGSMTRPDGFEEVEVADGKLWAGPGPGTWAWEGGGHTWTIVAEEPQLDPEELTEGLPIGGPSVVSRMGNWWARGFRWIGDRF